MTDNRLAARHAAWTVVFMTGLLLQACAPERPAALRPRVFAADVSGGAKACEVPTIAPVDEKTTAAAIKLGNDGGWCGLTVRQPGPKPFDAGLLTTRPAHGTVVIHEVGDGTRIDYTPDRGFVGNDSFAVRLLPGNASIQVATAVAAPLK